MWKAGQGKVKPNALGRPPPTPTPPPHCWHVLPQTLWKNLSRLVPGLQQGGPGQFSLISLDPAYLLLAAQRPSANSSMCTQPGSSWGCKSQSPGGEPVEWALTLVPWVTLGRFMTPLGLNISIPQLRCMQNSVLGCLCG